ncbi:MAG: hypothetical protein ACC742_08965 [Thermoanaerobaculales bacterium]
MNRVKWLVAVAAVTIIAGAEGFAQEQLDLQKAASRMRHNQKALQQYTWESQIKYEVDGVRRRVDLFRVRYDGNGSLERMQIGGESAKGKLRRPDGKKLSKKEREAAYAFAMEVKAQLDAYLSPLFAERAVSTATTTIEEDVIHLRAHDVVKPGDTVEIDLALSSKSPKRLRATTTINGSPVELEVSFGALEYGPICPERSVTTASWEGMKLAIFTENSNYSR